MTKPMLRCESAGATGRGKPKPKFDFAAYFTNLEKGKRVQAGGYQALRLTIVFC